MSEPLSAVTGSMLRLLTKQVADYPVQRLKVDLEHSFEIIGASGSVVAVAIVTAQALDWSKLAVYYDCTDGTILSDHPDMIVAFRRAILQRVARRNRGKPIPHVHRPRRQLEL